MSHLIQTHHKTERLDFAAVSEQVRCNKYFRIVKSQTIRTHVPDEVIPFAKTHTVEISQYCLNQFDEP
jgi:hypothetical protein